MFKNVVPEGLSKDRPIHLEDIKKSDFEQLWKFINTRFVVAFWK
jgi:hypothetical protein